MSHERLNRQLLDQTLRFEAALKNMSQGLAMFDAEQRVVIANDQFARLYGLAPEQVHPGMTLRQILEHHVANGHHAGKAVDEIRRRCSPTSRPRRPPASVS